MTDHVLDSLVHELRATIDASDTVGRFETDHPSLVETLNRIAQTLNAAGI